jgi:hypothetical protein
MMFHYLIIHLSATMVASNFPRFGYLTEPSYGWINLAMTAIHKHYKSQ